jgi:hypothetical protein
MGPLWRCPRCARRFANRNQTHTCGRHTLSSHFRGRSREIRAIYDAFVDALRTVGRVTVLPQKSRIAFQVRMSFAQLSPREKWVDGHFVLARRSDDPLFRRIDSISALNHVHHFRLVAAADVNPRLIRFMREAYAVGEQRHRRSS